MRAFVSLQPLHGKTGTDVPRHHRSTATAPADKMHAKIGKLAHPDHHPSTRLRTSVSHGRSYDDSPPRRAADASCTEDGVGPEVSGLGEEVGGLVSQAEGLLEESANGTCAAAVVWCFWFLLMCLMGGRAHASVGKRESGKARGTGAWLATV